MTDEKESENKSLVVRPDVEGTIQALEAFQKLKTSVLDRNDTVDIGGKAYIKRSGWRKIALAFNVSTEIVSVERERSGEMYIVRVKARASAPNGRVSEEIAVCDSSEFTGKLIASLHNVETKAATRAINRAISNLVGGGEVSAEEITTEEIENIKPQPHPEPKKEVEMITDKQRSAILQYGINDDEKEDYIAFFLEKIRKQIPDLTRKEASELIEHLTTSWTKSKTDLDFTRWRESHLKQ
ncbi:MAG: hypothetical protein QW292_08385 [Candidatus Parvarchaeota archaeon]